MSPHDPDGDWNPRTAGEFDTLCAHYGENREAAAGAAAPPLYQTSTFVFPDMAAFEHRDPVAGRYIYTRERNPTTTILEAKLAKLERGAWARGFGSGMAAITTAVTACVRAGDHVVALRNCYANGYLSSFLPRFGVETTFVQSTQLADFVAAFRDNTRLLYLESPTGGWYDILDLPALTDAARARGIRTIADNTWATPLFQNPLELGCDLVVHSASKYIGGHSDIVAGMLVGRDPDLRQRIAADALLLGAVLDPFAAWLLLRGLRTLPARMRVHEQNGLAVARLLAAHPAVARVFHPGLETHPTHALARRQMRGTAGLFSFALHEQTHDAARRFIERLRLFSIGVSWGGYESLVIGGAWGREAEATPERPRWTIRLACGLEAPADLVADVEQALQP